MSSLVCTSQVSTPSGNGLAGQVPLISTTRRRLICGRRTSSRSTLSCTRSSPDSGRLSMRESNRTFMTDRGPGPNPSAHACGFSRRARMSNAVAASSSSVLVDGLRAEVRQNPAMPPLALVVCPLPAGSIAARAADSLLARLPADPGVCVFCPEPYQAPAAWARRHRVLPLAELPFERQAGAITAPIYLLDGGPGERALRRYRDQVPGVEVDAAQPLDVAAV